MGSIAERQLSAARFQKRTDGCRPQMRQWTSAAVTRASRTTPTRFSETVPEPATHTNGGDP